MVKVTKARVARGGAGNLLWRLTLACGCQVRRQHQRVSGRGSPVSGPPAKLICRKHSPE